MRATPLFLLATLACEVPHAAPCPGVSQGTLRFKNPAPKDGTSSCSFAAPDTVEFVATVGFEGASNAWLCPDRAEALPVPGTHLGDDVIFSSAVDNATADVCAPVSIRQTVRGSLTRGDGGITGFTGTIVTDVYASPPEAGPEAGPDDGGADSGPADGSVEAGPSDGGCILPCTVSFPLTGTLP